jgi:hypothetical protein
MAVIPITPGEPIVSKPTEIEITPGRPPGERPLEIEPRRVWRVTDPAPALPEPERQLGDSGRGNRKPPRAPTSVEDAFGGNFPPSHGYLIGVYGRFPSVDEVARYYSFRSGSNPRNKHRAFGITVRESGYLLYASLVRHYHPRLSWPRCCEAAWRFIVTHHVHHFLVDRAVLTMEGVLRIAGCYSHDLWQAFHFQMQPFSSLEESASCAYSLRHVSDSEPAWTLTTLQPAGYAETDKTGTKIESTLGKLSHQKAVSRLLSLYVDTTTSLRQTGLHNLMQYENNRRGLRGDLFFNFQDVGLVEIPVRFGA